MNNIRKTKGNIYLKDTSVSNIFINDIMPRASGDFVKLYLLLLMDESTGTERSDDEYASILGMSVSDIKKAWDFWTKRGVIEKTEEAIEIVDLRDSLFCNGNLAKEENQVSKIDESKELQSLYRFAEVNLGKALNTNELTEISSWVTDVGASEEVIKRAISYCIEKNKVNIHYISKVVLQWAEDGLRTEEDVERYLDEIGAKNGLYKEVLSSLGLHRAPTKAEKEMIDLWVNKLGFDEAKIMEACNTTVSTSNPSIKYVNKVLENWADEAGKVGKDVNSNLKVNSKDLQEYYEYMRKEAERRREERYREVSEKLPRIKEIDEELLGISGALSMAFLKKGTKEETEELRRKAEKLEAERAYMLTENDFAADYTDIKYSCNLCNDTGVTAEGKKCDCVKIRIGEAELWQRNRLAKTTN